MTAPSRTVVHLDTERGWRGGQRQVLWLARGLAAVGWRSLVVARTGAPLAERAARAGLEVVPLAPLGELDPLAILRLARLVRRERAAIVHAHASHAITLAALAVMGTRARLVVSRRVAFRPRRHRGTRWKYGRADAIIAVSSAAAAGLSSAGVRPADVEIVPDGVDLSAAVRPAARQTLEALGIPPGAPIVVQVAALTREKDPLTAVRAIAAARRQVPELHGLLVGGGGQRGAVEAEIARLGVRDAVHLAGHRRDADELLAAADVCLLTSRQEGLGTVLLDALRLGVPVVACDAGGIPDVIAHGRTGLLAPVGDADALGDAIVRFLRDPVRRADVVAHGREHVRAFAIERTVERTAAVYERLIAGRAGHAGAAEAQPRIAGE